MLAFSEGINHYIETTSVLPFEFSILGITDFQRWEPEFSCYVMKFLEIQFAHGNFT